MSQFEGIGDEVLIGVFTLISMGLLSLILLIRSWQQSQAVSFPPSNQTPPREEETTIEQSEPNNNHQNPLEVTEHSNEEPLATEPQNEEEHHLEEPLVSGDGSIQIRLKSLDDRERTVRAKPTDLIGRFKSNFFQEELAANKTVRLIYNGQVLRDTTSLATYHVTENCVVHVQISNLVRRSPSLAPLSGEPDLNLGQLLWPLLALGLGLIWMCFFQYRDYFNLSSTVALIGLSGLFCTMLWGSLPRNP